MTNNRHSLLLGVTWTLTAFLLVAIALRIYTRVKVVNKVGADDYIMIVAVIFQLASQSLYTVSMHFGLGKHVNLLSMGDISLFLKYSWIATTPGILASITARISIAVLFLRIFNKVAWLRWYLYVITSIQTLVEFLVIIAVWAQCKPVSALWNPAIPRKCWNPDVQQDLAYLGQAIFTLCDLTYVLFPVLIVWNLNMKTRNKMGLIIALSLGIFTMVASVMKTITSGSSSAVEDPSYSISMPVLWSTVEQSLVIILGCVPPLRVLQWHKIVPLSNISSIGRYLISRRSRSKPGSRSTGAASWPYKEAHQDISNQELELQSRERSQDEENLAYSKDPNVISSISKVNASVASHDTTGIQRNDTYIVSYESPVRPNETV